MPGNLDSNQSVSSGERGRRRGRENGRESSQHSDVAITWHCYTVIIQLVIQLIILHNCICSCVIIERSRATIQQYNNGRKERTDLNQISTTMAIATIITITITIIAPLAGEWALPGCTHCAEETLPVIVFAYIYMYTHGYNYAGR